MKKFGRISFYSGIIMVILFGAILLFLISWKIFIFFSSLIVIRFIVDNKYRNTKFSAVFNIIFCIIIIIFVNVVK
ncbi:hypothetical protein EBB07_14600 [Paenibacillaceae bacterium]|nr:hypothetical protein EBB07_14600 [Paenibacillaceae bacterium]